MANYLILHFGIARFLSAVESQRDFRAEGNSIAHDTIGWAAEEGFGDLMKEWSTPEHRLDYRSAHAYRQRDLMAVISALVRTR
jgi:hypothetical protein